MEDVMHDLARELNDAGADRMVMSSSHQEFWPNSRVALQCIHITRPDTSTEWGGTEAGWDRSQRTSTSDATSGQASTGVVAKVR